MRINQPLQHAARYFRRTHERQGLILLQQLRESRAFDMGINQIRCPLVFARVIQRNDVGVLQATDDVRLMRQLSDVVIAQCLDGDLAVKLRVIGQINSPQPPLPQLTQNFETTNLLSGHD